jgi:predicted glutamine amidotransferase
MFAVEGSPEFAYSLQEALISAAMNDNFRKGGGSHDSGWGGVWYSEINQRLYRTTTPIFRDSNAIQFFECDRPLIGLSHARLAAPGEPIRGPFDSHPFSMQFEEELGYLTHNGQVDKHKLEESAKAYNVSSLNDSEVFTLLLEHAGGHSMKERLEHVIKVVHETNAMKGALNIMTLSIVRGGGKRIFYHCDFPDEDKELYYSLYVLKDGENSAVMSSTVAYKAGFIDKDGGLVNPNVTKCPRGKVQVL